MIVSWAIENNLVYLGVFWLGPMIVIVFSGHIHWWACDYDSFLGCWEIT